MRRIALLSFALVPALLAQLEPAPRPAADLAGDWHGSLAAGGMKLRLVLHLSKAGGTWKATLDSLDQGAMAMELSAVALAGESLSFELRAAGGRFEGRLAADGKTLQGTWTQGAALPLTFARSASPAPALRRPQKPEPPYPYEVKTVSIPAGAHTLAGTLTQPRGLSAGPAVVLVHGSGPNNRDESIYGHQPFQVLADHLTRKGVAVLRYDKRGVAQSTGSYATATTLDFADDAKAALAFLAAQPGIDGQRVGLLGHSEGGLVLPIVAAAGSQAAFLVLLAGPAVPGEEILYAQGEALLKAQGATPEALATQRKTQEVLFRAARLGTPVAFAQARQQLLAGVPAADRSTAASQLEIEISKADSPWVRTFLTLDPRPYLRKVKVPILALFAAKDCQVPPGQNQPEMEKALRAAANPQATVRVLPGLNHLFQTARSGAPEEYGEIEETLAPLALEAISSWILAHDGVARP